MAIPIRRADAGNIIAGSRTFFVTSSTAGKRNLLQSDRSAKLFIDVLCHYRSQHKYLLHAFVIMPDHFHVLITIGSELSIERAVQFIKGGFAFRAGRELGFKPPVWERGFSDVRVRDAEAFRNIREYIVDNPVEALLARSVKEYESSSAYPGFELDEAPQGLKPSACLDLVGTSEDVP
jgi:putative transposase